MCLSVLFSECQETADSAGRRAALFVCLQGPCAPVPRSVVTVRTLCSRQAGSSSSLDNRTGLQDLVSRLGRPQGWLCRSEGGPWHAGGTGSGWAAAQARGGGGGRKLRTSYGRTGEKGEPTRMPHEQPRRAWWPTGRGTRLLAHSSRRVVWASPCRGR